MNLNEDYFYIDEEKIYNLKYTHEQLVALLKKLEEGILLSKDQYKQLIEEIGLDNISTFDLDYFNLKNLPYIPVRLGDLYNDVGYDVKARVDKELNTLEEIIDSESARLDSVIAEVKSLNVSEVLNQIQNAQDKANYIDKSIKDLNGVIFSFERTIELIQDKTLEISTEFEALMNMQEKDENKLKNVETTLTIHTTCIDELSATYDSVKDKLTETITFINNIKTAVDDLSDYQGIMKNIDLRVSDIETFIKLLNPDEIDLNKILVLEDKLIELQEQHKVYNSFHKKITQQIDELISSFQQQIDELISDFYLDTINDRILSIQEQLKKNITTLSDHNKKLTEHSERIDNINSKLGTTTTAVNRNTSDIEDLKIKIFNDESWREEVNQQLTNIQNNISNNTININDLKSKIPGINNRLDSIDDKLDKFDGHIAEIKEDISSLENRVSSLEEQSLTFATKALVNSLELKAHINEEEEIITIKLTLDDEPLSSIDIPFFAKKEEEKDRIARTMNAWTNYSITATGNESLDTTARVDKGLTDYSTTN